MLIIALLSTILTARIVIVSSQPIINKPYISECTLLGDTNVPSNDSSFESRGKRDASCTDSGNKNNDNERRCKETRENYESSQRTTIYPDTGQIIPLFGRNVTWILGSDDGTYINIKTTVCY